VTVPDDAPLPDDIETLKAMLLAEREKHRAEQRAQEARIGHLKQAIVRLCQVPSPCPGVMARCTGLAGT